MQPHGQLPMQCNCISLVNPFAMFTRRMPICDKVIKKGENQVDRLIKPNQIYHEDCIAFMQKMSAANVLVDVIVTSPPYNINKEYGTYKDRKERDDYLDWLEDVAELSHSILKSDGSFFPNIDGRPADPALPFSVVKRFLRSDYELQNTIHWIKSVTIEKEDVGKNNRFRENGNVSIGHFKPIVSDRYLSDFQEYIFHFTKTGKVKLEKLAIGVTYQDKTNLGRWKSAIEDKRDRGNVWFIPYLTIQEERPHPAVFPVKLTKFCIKLHGREDKMMLVYDPFMGIGSTALACKHLGVKYIGTEIDSTYIKIAEEQISGKIETYLHGDGDELI